MKYGGSVLSVIECIYCREKQPTSAYAKAEHVIPQSFGKFRNNLTLRHLVCDACNQFFGDNVGLARARDTLEGQSRVDFGVKRAEPGRAPAPALERHYVGHDLRDARALADITDRVLANEPTGHGSARPCRSDADREHAAVPDSTLHEHCDIGGAAADIDQHYAAILIVGGQHRFARG